MEQFIRMLHHCGLPKTDIDFLYSDGPIMNEILIKGECKMTLFTGSQAVADKLAVDLKGRVKLEDAGFDWKVREKLAFPPCCGFSHWALR